MSLALEVDEVVEIFMLVVIKPADDEMLRPDPIDDASFKEFVFVQFGILSDGEELNCELDLSRPWNCGFESLRSMNKEVYYKISITGNSVLQEWCRNELGRERILGRRCDRMYYISLRRTVRSALQVRHTVQALEKLGPRLLTCADMTVPRRFCKGRITGQAVKLQTPNSACHIKQICGPSSCCL